MLGPWREPTDGTECRRWEQWKLGSERQRASGAKKEVGLAEQAKGAVAGF